DLRSTTVRLVAAELPSFALGICLLLAFQVIDKLVQRVEARAPEFAVPLDPGGLFFQPASSEGAGSYAPDLLRGHEPRLLQDADVLLHAREGHAEPLGKVGDRGIRIPELLQHAAPGDIGERGERCVEAGLIVNHMVHCTASMGDLQADDPAGANRAKLLCRSEPMPRAGKVPNAGFVAARSRCRMTPQDRKLPSLACGNPTLFTDMSNHRRPH